MKKKFYYLIFTVCLISVAFISCNNSNKNEKKKPLSNDEIRNTLDNLYNLIPPIAAKVNGTNISKDSVKISINTEINNFLAMKGTSLPNNKKFIKEIINTLINEELMYQQAKSKNFTINAEEINSEIDSLKKRFKNEEEFLKSIKEQGFSIKTIKKELTKTQAIRKFIKSLSLETKTITSDEELLNYYKKNITMFKDGESIKVSHILIKYDKDKPLEEKKAKEKIEGLRKKLNNSEDFAKLAKKHSEGPSAKRGGDLGYLINGTMVPSFEKAALNTKINNISDIIETPFGYHIIKVFDKREGRQLPFEEVKLNINDFLKQQKINNKITSIIKDLRKTATIEVLL